ncbi:uncharacterized protein LOC128559142 [Mercenaria mercenaria]|uniref:uncharacterized protein LOC128559142 n=1 Tax=Mercenaria mercenaria TaxID=6596 RepID=UPI00234F7DDA|nr:uncharacterized protein LOC128559142 [Mercenaria mercenaria]
MSNTKSKALTSTSKEIVNNVANYFVKEAKEPSNIPQYSFLQRTAEATGISSRTISRIRKEFKDSGSLTSPKRTSPKELKTVDDFDRCAIRNKIYEFYTVRHELPTLTNLHEALKEDIDFIGSKSLLRKIIRELGFRWKRTNSQRKVLLEKQSVVELRLKYYAKKKQLEEAGYDFVYIDETWVDTSHTAKYCWQAPGMDGVTTPVSKGQRLIIVHGGSNEGFVPGALLIYNASSSSGDYHHEMNGENFCKWMQEKLLPNIKKKSAIVMDNASYHSVQSSKCPNSSTRKADIQKWLTEHNIQYDPALLRPQLLALAEINKPEPAYVIDAIVRGYGHEVLRLPPYHPDLNPIELIWSQVKSIIASRNLTYRSADLVQIANSAFEEIGADRWRRACVHAQKTEISYRETDIVVDVAMDNLVIDLAEDSDSDETESASEGED